VRSSMAAATARRGGKSKRLYAVTPLGLRTARELHRMRQEIWTTIAEGRQS
jgi:DNA-binding PadR family transcriptional regulator